MSHFLHFVPFHIAFFHTVRISRNSVHLSPICNQLLQHQLCRRCTLDVVLFLHDVVNGFQVFCHENFPVHFRETQVFVQLRPRFGTKDSQFSHQRLSQQSKVLRIDDGGEALLELVRVDGSPFDFQALFVHSDHAGGFQFVLQQVSKLFASDGFLFVQTIPVYMYGGLCGRVLVVKTNTLDEIQKFFAFRSVKQFQQCLRVPFCFCQKGRIQRFFSGGEHHVPLREQLCNFLIS
mmetsp:Transcript_25675/g.64550  ORF Transcript_25675/g.64550 Transcript_25675/m.64550 type:complete len:234 (-) Transcript_25675:2955-3656(-)